MGLHSAEIRGQLLTNKRAKQQTDSSSNNSTAKVTLPLGHDLPVKKKRTKQQVDPSDATAKVTLLLGHHLLVPINQHLSNIIVDQQFLKCRLWLVMLKASWEHSPFSS